jgi:hypothetical protein
MGWVRPHTMDEQGAQTGIAAFGHASKPSLLPRRDQ